MAIKFNGAIDELKALVESTGIFGEWQSDSKGKQTFRSESGGFFNLWSNGTVNFQGKPEAKAILERTLEKLLARKTSNVKTDRASENAPEPFAISRPQISYPEDCHGADPFMRQVKEALSSSGLTIILLNGLKYIVSKYEYEHYRSLDKIGLKINVREL